MELQKQSRILRASLIAAIVIVINLFFNYALSLVYKEPDYNTFCPNTAQVVTQITNQAQCVAAGGQWNENYYPPTPVTPDGKGAPTGYCDQQFMCRQGFETAQKTYDRNVFITLVLLGAIIVAIGNYLKGNQLISSALSLAGVLSFIIASMRYWSSADNLIKVIILGIALAILIYVAMKKFKN
ncbi:MAG: hypothetical protein PHV42_02405 [Candidatus Pacebacteria bacterium]|nr:hypothetical protein [Candidatus Paceibacterota bacterium]